MSRKNPIISELIKSTIEPISNKAYQKRVWVNGEGPECDSFDETVCDFYYYFEAIINKPPEILGINEDQLMNLINFEKTIKSYCDSTPPISNDREIIKDPKWHKIRIMAKKLRKSLES